MSVTVHLVDEADPAALWDHPADQPHPLPCFVRLDLSSGKLTAVASGSPDRVTRTGVVVQWAMPLVTAQGANELLRRVRPIAEDVYLGDRVDKLTRRPIGSTKRRASGQIRLLAADQAGEFPRVEERDPRPVIEAWGPAYLGITAATSDAGLRRIAGRVRAGITPTLEGNRVVLWPSAMPLLRRLRDQQADGTPQVGAPGWRERQPPLRLSELAGVLVARVQVPLSTRDVAGLCRAAYPDSEVTTPAVAAMLESLADRGMIKRLHGTDDRDDLVKLGVDKPHGDWGYWMLRERE